ncbi:hypothetical protein SKAU_G00043310 [Synaphobranchus kaupii]|uniref:Uncharacterized protein n=1 Tax=Synaphobranchus kaupii TaxID=118154 RepID=A0A9Q1G1Y8_SYNKA|nr:hypothetical protein SKAU_G00043310 [Synaphobranchus kaupii]
MERQAWGRAALRFPNEPFQTLLARRPSGRTGTFPTFASFVNSKRCTAQHLPRGSELPALLAYSTASRSRGPTNPSCEKGQRRHGVPRLRTKLSLALHYHLAWRRNEPLCPENGAMQATPLPVCLSLLLATATSAIFYCICVDRGA